VVLFTKNKAPVHVT